MKCSPSTTSDLIIQRRRCCFGASGLYLTVSYPVLRCYIQQQQCETGVFFQLWKEQATRCRPAGNLFIYYRQACWCTPLYLAKPIILQWPFLHECHHTAVHEILMEMLAVLGLPGWVCCLTESYNSKAEATFKTVGATTRGRHTQPLTNPPQPQKAGEYQMWAAWNFTLRHTPTSTNDVSYWHLLISHFISFYIRSPALFLWHYHPYFINVIRYQSRTSDHLSDS